MKVLGDLARSPCSLDPLVVFDGSETYANLKAMCGQVFKEVMELQLQPFALGDEIYNVDILLV